TGPACVDPKGRFSGDSDRVTKKSLALLVLLLVIVTGGCGPSLPRPSSRPGSRPKTTNPRVNPRAPKPPADQPPGVPVQPPPPKNAKPAEPVPEKPPEPPLGPTAPLLLKVGLASDLETVTLPCCEEGLIASVDDVTVPVTSTIKVEPAAASASQGSYRLQVAALRDELQATELAKRLEKATGQPGE